MSAFCRRALSPTCEEREGGRERSEGRVRRVEGEKGGGREGEKGGGRERGREGSSRLACDAILHYVHTYCNANSC